jgi:nitrogen regulatory protein PII
LNVWKASRVKTSDPNGVFRGHGSCSLYPWSQTNQTNPMKRIEAVVKRSALDDFRRCAKQLGIFGFDLSENPTKRRDHQRLDSAGEHAPDATSRIKVDFAVLDEETKPTVHAVLESVHPESIAIFKFDQDTRAQTSTRRDSLQRPKPP